MLQYPYLHLQPPCQVCQTTPSCILGIAAAQPVEHEQQPDCNIKYDIIDQNLKIDFTFHTSSFALSIPESGLWRSQMHVLTQL